MEAHRNKPILNRTQRLFLALLIAAAGLFIDTAPSWADDPDPSTYAPSGMGSLFSTPDLKGDQNPTLYEQYPEAAYTFDYVDGGLLDFGIVDYNLNNFANTIFMSTRTMTNAAITLTWQTQSFDGFEEFSPQLKGAVSATAEAFSKWLLPSALAIGAVIALVQSRREVGEAINQAILVALSGIVALSLATNADSWLTAMQKVREAGITTASEAIALSPSSSTSPFEGPTPTFSDDAQTTSMRVMGDSIWRTFVVTPWCLGEFGTQSACQQWGTEVLGRTQSERETYISQTVREPIGGDQSAAYKIASGHNGAYRLSIAGVSFLTAAIFCLVIIGLNLIVLANVISALIMLILGGFFACMWAIPGAPRSWANRWFSLLVGFVALTFLGFLVLAAALAVTGVAILLSSTLGWMSSVLITFVSIVAAFAAIGHVRTIFGASSTGVARTLGGALGLAMMTRSFVGSLRRNKSPKGPRRSSKEPSSPEPPDSSSGSRGPAQAGGSPSEASGGGRRVAVSNRRRPAPRPAAGVSEPLRQSPSRRSGEHTGPARRSDTTVTRARDARGTMTARRPSSAPTSGTPQNRPKPRHAAQSGASPSSHLHRRLTRSTPQARARQPKASRATGGAHLRANPPRRRRRS